MKNIRPCFLLCLVLASCARPPEIRQLPGKKPESPRLFLSGELSSQDFRRLFYGMNPNGRLDALKPFLERGSEEKLNAVAKIVSRYTYQETELLRFLEKRVQEKSFSKIRDLLKKHSNESQFAGQKKVLRGLVSHPEFPLLLKKDIGFLAPEWTWLARGILRDLEALEKIQWPSPQNITGKEVVLDASQLIHGDKKGLLELFQFLGEQELITRAMAAFSSLYSKHGVRAFEGLGKGISRMVLQPPEPKKLGASNKLELLLRFVESGDTELNDLLEPIRERLTSDFDSIKGISVLLQPLVAGAVAGMAREILSEGETPLIHRIVNRSGSSDAQGEETKLFTALLRGADSLKPYLPEAPVAEDAFERSNSYLGALAVSHWFQELVKQNRASFLAISTRSPKAFSDKVWDVAVKAEEFSWSALEKNAAGGKQLKAQVKKELEALGLRKFAAMLDELVSKTCAHGKSESSCDRLGRFDYVVAAIHSPLSLKAALREAFRQADGVRAFENAGTLVNALAFFLTRGEGGIGLGDFRGNLMNGVHRSASYIDYPLWKKFRVLAFEDMGIGTLSSDFRKVILDFFEASPKATQKVSALLDSVEMLNEIDKSVTSLPSAFESYHAVASVASPQSLTSLLAYASQQKLVAKQEDGKPRFPSVLKAFANARPLAEIALALGTIPKGSRHDFLLPFRGVFENVPEHLSVFESLLDSHGESLAAVWDSLSLKEMAGLIDAAESLSLDEREWLMRVVKRGAHEPLWNYASAITAQEVRALVNNLKELSRKGFLLEAFSLLGNFSDDMLQRWSKLLVAMAQNGELDALMETLRLWGEA